MKILTVNVIGLPSSSSDNLTNARVFQDYNALVVDPESLNALYGHDRISYSDRKNGILTSESAYLLSIINDKRREQVNGLLLRGGIIVCFLEPLRKYSYEWHQKGKDFQSFITNYDWLIESDDIYRELGEIKYSKGNTIDYIDTSHPFSEYLNTRPPWSAYIDKDTCEYWKILASAFGTHAVSIIKRVGLGYIILLPSYYDHNNGELLQRCIIKLLGDNEINPQPSWAKSTFVPGQNELFSKIKQLNEQINALEIERKKLVDVNEKLERWKYLLYEKGKHQLEPVVRDALALLGCKVEPQPDKDSDGLVTFEFGIALIEVVGSKATIRIEKLGELIKNIGNYISKKGGMIKGILIGNPFCDEPLDNRPPQNSQKQLFSKELLESAEQQSIAVLLSTDLYEVMSSILKGEFSEDEKKYLLQHIFEGKGLVRLVQTEGSF